MSYVIKVVRKGVKGTLTFSGGDTSVSTDCWWDPTVKVVAGTYTGYATRMASKSDGADGGKREAIWLGMNVPVNGGRTSNAIFIHKGNGPGWSDGCIVALSPHVVAIWNAITPKETGNVSIVIEDQDEPAK